MDLCAWLAVDLNDRYKIFFNRESGLEDACGDALLQIREKRYADLMLSRGVAPERIYACGFAFKDEETPDQRWQAGDG